MLTLRRGDHNTNVALWQAFLIKRGFGVTADADFGPKTEEATKLFQYDRQLERADGIVGPRTIDEAIQLGFAGFPSGGTPISKPASPINTDKLILVSAGHTNAKGGDQGAAGNGFVEGAEAVKVRDKVAAILRKRGFSVLEDGADGVNDPLAKALVLARKVDVAIEIHFNSFEKTTATGVEVLAKPAKKALAQRIASGISRETGIAMRGTDGGWKSDGSGQHHRLGFCEAGGLVVELCFISNPQDMRKYSDRFDAVCTAIADALAA